MSMHEAMGRILEEVEAADFTVTAHGSIYTLKADAPEVEAWLEDHLVGEVQTWGGQVCIEPRYVGQILEALEAEGFVGAWA